MVQTCGDSDDAHLPPHAQLRPVVLPDSVEVELKCGRRAEAWVSFDGKTVRLCSGDSIFIREQFPVPTVNYEDQTGDFISLRRCLRWNER